jgi:hypothetical protein
MARYDARAPAAACLFAIGLASAAVQSATTVHVGDGTLDGSFLVPYNNAWFYSVRFSDGRELPEGIWSDHLQWTTVNGRRVMLRVQGVTFISGASNVIMNVFSPETLAPISSETHNVDGSVFKRTFDGAHITSVSLAGSKDTKPPAVSVLPHPVYDFNGGMYGILMASLPLREGLRGTLPAIADGDDKLTSEPFEVLRQEDVEAGARGKVKAWVVESARPGDYTMKFWVTKTAPYIIKLVMTDTTHGRVLTWDML